MTSTSTPLRQKFNALPTAIQEWLTSERIADRIIEINEKFGLLSTAHRKIIPTLIFRLAIKDLDPREFINELHRLTGVDLIEAKLITEELDQAILRQVRSQLKTASDVDINLLYAWEPRPYTPTQAATEEARAGAPVTSEELPKESLAIPKIPSLTIPFKPAPSKPLPTEAWPTPKFIPATPNPTAKLPVSKPLFKPLDIKPVSPKTDGPRIIPTMAMNPILANALQPTKLKEEAAPAPFVLHEEKSAVKSSMETAPQAPRPSLTFKMPVTISKPAPQRITHKPINVAIETPFEEKKSEQVGVSKPQQRRVVHYSDLRTPIDPFADINKK